MQTRKQLAETGRRLRCDDEHQEGPSFEQTRAAAEADAKFRTMFEQGMHFAGILSRDGIVVEANRLSLEACGFAREEVVNKFFWECGWWNRSPALADMIRGAALRAANGQLFRQETPYYLADGSKRYVELTIAPVTDESGNVIFLSAIGNDITDRRLAELALTASAQRLRFLDRLGEMTRAANDPEEVMHVTTRALTEYLGTTRCAYADVEPDNDHFTIRHDWTVEGVASSAGTYSLDLFGSKAVAAIRRGQTLVIRDVDSELAGGDGADMFNKIGIKAIICAPLVKDAHLVAMMAVHQSVPRTWTEEDISIVEQVAERSWAHIERVRSAIALTAADRHKDEFLATLAHELRNPLAPLRSGLQILRLTEHDMARRHEVQDMMERQLRQMVRLIDDLLDVNRISRNKLVLQLERIDIARVLANAIEASRPHIDAAAHELKLDLPPQPLYVKADFTRLSQAFLNLLNNSAKYTPARGRIHVCARRERDKVLVTVEDNGIGIPHGSLGHIFEMFGQVDRAIERSTGGLGIGLSLVKALVEKHGGTVFAESPGSQKGARFTVRLPLDTAASDEHSQASTSTPQSLKRRVLIVDDNRDAAMTLAHVLSIMGNETLTAHDGLDAVEQARKAEPDVVLMDIGMPKLNGYEATRRIRQLLPGKDMIIIALTGWGQEEDKRLAAESGCDGHMVKPVSLTALQDLITELVQRKGGAGASCLPVEGHCRS